MTCVQVHLCANIEQKLRFGYQNVQCVSGCTMPKTLRFGAQTHPFELFAHTSHAFLPHLSPHVYPNINAPTPFVFCQCLGSTKNFAPFCAEADWGLGSHFPYGVALKCSIPVDTRYWRYHSYLIVDTGQYQY